jgi:hypothetical protein
MTATASPLAEQVPDTVYEAWFAAVIWGAATTATTGNWGTAPVLLVVDWLAEPGGCPDTVCVAVIVTVPSGRPCALT